MDCFDSTPLCQRYHDNSFDRCHTGEVMEAQGLNGAAKIRINTNRDGWSSHSSVAQQQHDNMSDRLSPTNRTACTAHTNTHTQVPWCSGKECQTTMGTQFLGWGKGLHVRDHRNSSDPKSSKTQQWDNVRTWNHTPKHLSPFTWATSKTHLFWFKKYRFPVGFIHRAANKSKENL